MTPLCPGPALYAQQAKHPDLFNARRAAIDVRGFCQTRQQ
jgi:hypothetical protein